ncbi:hypothetical protein OH77DRAFT_1517852 [Trametes cingulata]|nr:hypothetical protein OH77DRAFT_1517852 [Trametes cingulata]
MTLTHFETTPMGRRTFAVRHDPSGLGPGSLAAQFKTLKQYRLASAEDMAHKAIRMEPAAFADRFFPVPSDATRPRWAPNTFNRLALGGALLETQIVERFTKAVNDNDLAPGLEMATSTDRPDMEDVDDFRQKIDAAFFKTADAPSDGRPHWVDQLVSVEFKRHETDNDPFDDRDERVVDAQAVERKKVRGQIITYAEHIFRIQHRTALYMLLVIGRNFRFVRWDRSGAIVTRAVDYVTQPRVLCELLWRMSKQSDEQLGIDPSAARLFPDDEDYKLMDECAMEQVTDLATDERIVTDEEIKAEPLVFKYVRLSFRRAIEGNWPRYRLEVPFGMKTRSFLVGKPTFHAHGMAGRGTRGYVALDLETKKFVWLKDAWRVHYELMDQEGSVLSQLNEKRVRFVPTLICHGDIRDQETVTPQVWEEQNPSQSTKPSKSAQPPTERTLSSSATLAAPQASSSSRKRTRSELDSEATLGSQDECPLRRHKHYRVVVEEVAMPLSEFQCGRQLVQAVLDCIMGHWDATTKAQILHRDVSGGNVLILPKVSYDRQTEQTSVKWRGLLADWEMSKPISDKEQVRRPRQPPRTGTWQFLSVGMLSHYPKAPDIPDELESFFYVILYNAVRYLHSNCENPAAWIEAFFDAHTVVTKEIYTCGIAKLITVQTNGRLEVQVGVSDVLKFDSPLDAIFEQLLRWFKAHYKVQKYRNQQAKAEDPANAPRPSPDDDDAFPSPPSSPSPKRAEDCQDIELSEDALSELAPEMDPHSYDDIPTAQDELYASYVANHRFVVGVLARQLKSKAWGADKVGDRVPPEYKPQYPLADPHCVAPSTAKRRRTIATLEYHTCHHTSLPDTPDFRSMPIHAFSQKS